MSAPDGLLVVDKPAGWTSHDVVGRARRLCGTRRVGHAGTLDPMATGVLVLGVNKATRLLTFLVGSDKAYTATIRLGQSTITDDAEGEVVATAPADRVDAEALRAAVAALTGEIEQVPSAVSAIKVDGERSYARVRAGEDVVLAARPVTVPRFEVLGTRQAEADGVPVLDVDVEVEVSSGTYVRALARDLGAALGVGGHLTALRRTRVGSFTLDQAHTLPELEAAAETGDAAGAAARRRRAQRFRGPRAHRGGGHGGGVRPADRLRGAGPRRAGGGLRARRHARRHARRVRAQGEGARRLRPCQHLSAGGQHLKRRRRHLLATSARGGCGRPASCSAPGVRRVSLVHRWTDPAQTPDSLRPSVATFGNFDGVHRGHRAVLGRLVEEAGEPWHPLCRGDVRPPPGGAVPPRARAAPDHP